MRILIFILLFCISYNCEIIEAKYLGSSKEASKVVNPKSRDVCLTPECKEAASEILRNMDPKVAPCDDFYKFACGNFVKTTVVPKTKTLVDKLDLLNDKIQKQVRTALEENIRPNEPKFVKLTKNYYKSCMNTATMDKNGLQPILDDLKTLGGWPVLRENSWKDEELDWKNTTYRLMKMGYQADYLFAINSFVFGNNSALQLLLNQTSLGLDPEYLVKGLSDKFVRAYYSYMVDIAVILGADRRTAEKEMKESLAFEIQLANLCVSGYDTYNSLLNKKMTLKEISEKYPSISKEYLSTILKPFVQIGDDEVIAVLVPSFFEKFDKLIKETPKKILSNYLGWRTVYEVANYLPDKVRNRRLKFLTVISGTGEIQPRWIECLEDTTSNLQTSVNALYVDKYFQKDSKKSAVDLVDNIKKEFTKILKKTDWMDEKTRKGALDKIDAMTEIIGYPDELLDNKKVEEMYNDLDITTNNPLRASLNVSHFMTNYNMNLLREPLKKWMWNSLSLTDTGEIGYYYNVNFIELTAAILQDIFFNKDRPHCMNYAAIGWLVGRLITHSFDATSEQYDKDGNFIGWPEPETKNKYDDKTECIVQQYGKYSIEELESNVNGNDTRYENTADNEGLKAAYLAYQDWVKQNSPEPKLPRINYSPSQIFWISAAQSVCTKYTKKGLEESISQSPAEFRVKGAFSNRPEFAKDFNCPVGSNMNPVKKCPVW